LLRDNQSTPNFYLACAQSAIRALIGLEVYDQLEFGRLLHWQLTRAFIPQNVIYIRSRAYTDRSYLRHTRLSRPPDWSVHLA
jgi:hypothetical protein